MAKKIHSALLTGSPDVIVADGVGTVWDGNDNDNLIVGHRLDETLSGFGGNDVIYGGLGNDTINGGDGNDRIQGDAGADVLTGGAGNDTFVFTNWSESPDTSWNESTPPTHSVGLIDSITDFEAGDKIDVSGQGVTSFSQIDILNIGVNQYHIEVHTIPGDTRWDIGIDVTGVAPTEANFVLA